MANVTQLGAAGTPKQTTLTDQLIRTRASIQDLLNQLRGFSDRAGVNRSNPKVAETGCDSPAESNALCDVVADIGNLSDNCHNVLHEILQIV